MRYFCEALSRRLREFSRHLCIVVERSKSIKARKLLSPITEVHLREYSRQLCTVDERSQPAQVRKLLSSITELHLENIGPFCKGMCEPLMRIIEPFHMGILRINEPLRRIIKPLFERIPESHCPMICKPVYGMIEVLSNTKSIVQHREMINGATVLKGLPARYSTIPFIDRGTVKAVSSQSLNESKPIVMSKCGICSSDSKDVKVIESSDHIFRCSVRELKRSKGKHLKKGQGTVQNTCEEAYPKNEKKAN